MSRLTPNVSHGLADPKRVYATGISNGGMMVMRLAYEHPDRFATIAVVAANQPVDLECKPGMPVPAVFFHGTHDRFMPFAGGDVLLGPAGKDLDANGEIWSFFRGRPAR